MSRPGHEILDELEQTFRRFTIQQAPQDYEALALWSLYTHAAASFDYAPRLVLTSAEKRSGKSRTMEIAAALTHNPMMTASVTPAALYRSIPNDGGTLTVFADEADTIYGKNASSETAEALRGFINAGFRRGFPTMRCEGPSNIVTAYYTFSPVCIAAIGHLPDTVVDRAVNIRLRRRKASETVDSYRLRTDEPGLLDLAAAATEWAIEHADEITAHTPIDVPVDDRAADLWEPLITVADIAGGSWPDRARDAARHHTGAEADDEDESTGIELLRDTKEVLELHHGDRIGSSSLVELLRGKDESRWADEDLKPRRLAMTLKEFGIRPTRMPSGSGRGYWISNFEDAFDRYLTPSIAPIPPTPSPQATEATDLQDDQGEQSSHISVTSPPSVTSSDRPTENRQSHPRRSRPESVASVTSSRGVDGEEGEQHLGPQLFDAGFGHGGDAA
ncbi:DUF3631 domain-containing protein [Brachybacterium fresconis]|uniref:DUF3631 domain-containing protein n=1 Tax=Brachybacterium fresconis TaxID=173363 RepID=A0ABS4YK22_9MICO|nr:DUF3631 domain-containing protein [Brachybacterium fresconis]MBP2408268.1 hypothetical protein [Brachybacterium fresconis]